ncbi:hypothetical protein [Burkholderia ubonensis]|uniref:hypothetical protein n=1 Tax=Burkholderia ubonensis TaxID=101571 RepID=UPI0009B40FBF|nr:hypothetical protein [Burkholderia ubonensis]
METINDGGPAFPINDHQLVHRVGAAAVDGVTDSAERDRIYTEATARASAGMALRDYFAANAIAAVLRTPWFLHTSSQRGPSEYAPELAAECYAIADAMLRAREA